MQRTRSCQIWMCVIVVNTACALPPLADPNVPASHGVIIGQFRIFDRGVELTEDCTIGLRDASPLQIDVRPDTSGWVIASVARGKVRIASVDCAGEARLATLDVHVLGDGHTTYFGHVRMDLHREIDMRPSRHHAAAFAAAMRAGSSAHDGTIAGAVHTGVVALNTALVLGQPAETVRATVEVEDRTYEAVAAFAARYGGAPKALAVSLAGSVFSSEPIVSTSVQKAGEVIYSEASMSGVRLTWLASASQAQHTATLRVQRFVRKDVPCASMRLALDGREIVVPAASKTERASVMLRQTVQGEVDSPALREVARAKRVLVDVCGTARAFSELARAATREFARAHAELRANLHPRPITR